jgi:hypothetical protein
VPQASTNFGEANLYKTLPLELLFQFSSTFLKACAKENSFHLLQIALTTTKAGFTFLKHRALLQAHQPTIKKTPQLCEIASPQIWVYHHLIVFLKPQSTHLQAKPLEVFSVNQTLHCEQC